MKSVGTPTNLICKFNFESVGTPTDLICKFDFESVGTPTNLVVTSSILKVWELSHKPGCNSSILKVWNYCKSRFCS
ncbi:hypothetical protein LEP1GSC109_1652 [Leptospira interrogans str. UI 13372]|nr:hypothetical protein LEP1GSC109_1652 [Leptospira interrogans str. UI 13372]